MCFITVTSLSGGIYNVDDYITGSWVSGQKTNDRKKGAGATVERRAARNSAMNSEILCGVLGVTGTGAWPHVHVRTYEDASRITVYR